MLNAARYRRTYISDRHPGAAESVGEQAAQQQAHASISKGYRLAEGEGAYVNGNANGNRGQRAWEREQNRKPGISTGGGGYGYGSKAAPREGEGRVDAKPIDTGFGPIAGVGLGLGGGSSVWGAGLGSDASASLGGAESGGESSAGGLEQEGGDAQGVGEESRDEIRCPCGSSLDGGFSIAFQSRATCAGGGATPRVSPSPKRASPRSGGCWMCAPEKHVHYAHYAPTPTQRHLIAQLANIPHAPDDSGVECACAGNVVATPAHWPLPSSSHLHPPNGKGCRTIPGSDNGVRERAVSAERVDAEEHRGNEECVIRTTRRVVFPPSGHRRTSATRTPKRWNVSRLLRRVVIDASASTSSSSLPVTASTSGLSHFNPKVSSSTSTTTPTLKHKRLAGQACRRPAPRRGTTDRRGARVRVVERVRGSGGWGGVMLEGDGERYGSDGYGSAYAGGYGYFDAGNAFASASNEVYGATGSGGAYALRRRRTRGWKWATGMPIASGSHNDEMKWEEARESVCPPKSRKRWKDADRAVISRNLAPPRLDKGRGWAPAPGGAMEVDFHLGRGGPYEFRHAAAFALDARTIPSTLLSRRRFMSPHPNARPRPSWFLVGAGANVKVLEHEDSASVNWGRKMERRSDATAAREAVSEPATGEILPTADAIVSASPSEELESSARRNEASARVHFDGPADTAPLSPKVPPPAPLTRNPIHLILECGATLQNVSVRV
ncbi:hypothetical protein K438DRAFT_1988729 [Mycena galopus ATCC 62051]|nr:hypothetical protein K438DRAFT_1988729 [Mycena galopus ATCC 62051]